MLFLKQSRMRDRNMETDVALQVLGLQYLDSASASRCRCRYTAVLFWFKGIPCRVVELMYG